MPVVSGLRIHSPLTTNIRGNDIMKKLTLLGIIGVLMGLAVSLCGQDSDRCFFEYSGTKRAKIPPYLDAIKVSGTPTVTVTIRAAEILTQVSDYIYGTNANIYSGRYNTAPLLIDYIDMLSPNIIRYPGGLHSNEYFWNATPATLPDDLPEKLQVGYSNDTYDPYWVAGSGVSWQFSLEDFYEFLDETGSEGLITVNYSYARYGTGPTPVQTAAHLAADWVRYDNGLTTFWEIGNENCSSWASGYKIDTDLNQDGQPQIITPKLYGEHAKVFIDSMKKAADEISHTIFVGVQNDRGVLEGVGNAADWFVDHTYFTPYQQNSPVSAILNSVENELESFIQKTESETNKSGVSLKPNALTEWNIFSCGRGQRASYVNGMHAVIVLGEMIKRQYGLANRWDIVNGWGDGDGSGPEIDGDDFGMFSGGGDPDGPAYHWNPRASFYYMYYFQRFFGDHLVQSSTGNHPDILAYASSFSSGELGIVVMNRSESEEIVQLDLRQYEAGSRYYVYSLTGGDDNGDFSYQVFVNGFGPDTQIGGPIEILEDIDADAFFTEGNIRIRVPGLSSQFILVEGDIKVSVEPGHRPSGGLQTRAVLYPSPARKTFQVRVQQGLYEKMDVIDIRGRVVCSMAVHPGQTFVQVNTDLAAGTYFVRLHQPKEITIRKMILLK